MDMLIIRMNLEATGTRMDNLIRMKKSITTATDTDMTWVFQASKSPCKISIL
mgnify:CR=1 FL=1